jgi:hypothetical protein
MEVLLQCIIISFVSEAQMPRLILVFVQFIDKRRQDSRQQQESPTPADRVFESFPLKTESQRRTG